MDVFLPSVCILLVPMLLFFIYVVVTPSSHELTYYNLLLLGLLFNFFNNAKRGKPSDTGNECIEGVEVCARV